MNKEVKEIIDYCERENVLAHIATVLQNLVDGYLTEKQLVGEIREIIRYHLRKVKKEESNNVHKQTESINP